jgi:hypothetical protein
MKSKQKKEFVKKVIGKEFAECLFTLFEKQEKLRKTVSDVSVIEKIVSILGKEKIGDLTILNRFSIPKDFSEVYELYPRSYYVRDYFDEKNNNERTFHIFVEFNIRYLLEESFEREKDEYAQVSEFVFKIEIPLHLFENFSENSFSKWISSYKRKKTESEKKQAKKIFDELVKNHPFLLKKNYKNSINEDE